MAFENENNLNNDSYESSNDGGFDSFINEIKIETEDVKNENSKNDLEKRKIQEEKISEFFKNHQEEISNLAEKASQEKIFKGQQDYFALTNNFEGYKKSFLKSISHKYNSSLLFKEISKEYEENVGEPFYMNSVPNSFQTKTSSYTVDSYFDRDIGEVSEEDYIQKNMPNDEDLKNYMKGTFLTLRGQGLGLPDINSLGQKAISENPEQYIDNLRKIRDYHHSREYQLDASDIKGSLEVSEDKKRIDDNVYLYDKKAQGFIFGALESGDLKTAAKALVFSESVRKIDKDISEIIKQQINLLSPEQKQEFVSFFEQEKQKKKN